MSQFGLVFPLQGQTFATAPEIFTARRLGAEIEILHGVVIPTGELRPLAQVVEALTAERSKHAPGTLVNALCKELSNTVFGKTGQGIRNKKVFDARTGRSKPMPKSQLTNPYFAAWVTGYIRALLGEIMNAIPEGRTIVSVTANKVKGGRAALIHDILSAHQGVEDDDMNVICFGARVLGCALDFPVLGPPEFAGLWAAKRLDLPLEEFGTGARHHGEPKGSVRVDLHGRLLLAPFHSRSRIAISKAKPHQKAGRNGRGRIKRNLTGLHRCPLVHDFPCQCSFGGVRTQQIT